MKVRHQGGLDFINKLVIGTAIPGRAIAHKNVRPPSGALLSARNVVDCLTDHAKILEKVFPGKQFRVVMLNVGHYNFIHQDIDRQK